MDLGTIVGVGLGGAMILLGIITSGGNIMQFINLPSILVVVGGSFAAMLVGSPLSRMLGIMRYMNLLLRVPSYEEERIISTLVNFSEKARREGLLALEDDLEEVEEEFMRKGIQLVVDGTDPDIIKSVLYNDLNQLEERHQVGIKLFDDWSKIAPAFGMIGTLAGLISMLANLDDASSIGPNMSLALITTMYGAMMANLLLIPFRNKLQDRNNNEVLVREVMIEGVLSIQSGDNPRILEEKLLSFLPPTRREAVRQESVRE
jgi:chemotaxis protein MotA